MKISARNIVKGKIVEVKKGTTTAHVRIDIGGQVVTAAITNESVDDPATGLLDEALARISLSMADNPGSIHPMLCPG